MLSLIAITLSLLLATGAPLPHLYGAFMRVEIFKDGTSELSTTLLGEGQVVPLTGTAPFANTDGTEGELIPFVPLDACRPLQLSNYTKKDEFGGIFFKNTGPLTNSIALIAPGGCPLETKILNVQKVPNAVGALFYVNRGVNLSEVSGKLTDVDGTIPGFIISNALGEDLLRKVTKYRTPGPDTDFDLPAPSEKGVTKSEMRRASNDPWVKVSLFYVNESTSPKGVIVLILMFLVVFLLAGFIGSCLMHFQAWRARRREFEAQSQRHTDEIPNLPPIDRAFIDLLPKSNYRTQLHSEENEKDGKAPIEGLMPIHWANEGCPICLDSFVEEEELCELPCGHHYHSACINPWLLHRSPCCPLCKIDSRVGPRNALLIQMGKEPDLPKPRHPGFLRFFVKGCWDMIRCREGGTS